jgi:hypothetical protein
VDVHDGHHLLPVHFRELGFSAGFYTPLATVMILAGAVGTIAGGRSPTGRAAGPDRGGAAAVDRPVPDRDADGQLARVRLHRLFGLFSDSSLTVTLLAAQRLLPGERSRIGGDPRARVRRRGRRRADHRALSDRIGIPDALAITAVLPIAAAVGALLMPAAIFGLGARSEPGDDRPTGTPRPRTPAHEVHGRSGRRLLGRRRPVAADPRRGHRRRPTRVETIRDETVPVLAGDNDADLSWQIDQYTQETIGVTLAAEGWEVFSTTEREEVGDGGPMSSPVYLVRQT